MRRRRGRCPHLPSRARLGRFSKSQQCPSSNSLLNPTSRLKVKPNSSPLETISEGRRRQHPHRRGTVVRRAQYGKRGGCTLRRLRHETLFEGLQNRVEIRKDLFNVPVSVLLVSVGRAVLKKF